MRRYSCLTDMQGFDEFMNLVIDDAVEVAQVTKANEKETRRSLGKRNITEKGLALTY